jgi:hypothetical protein
MFRHRLRIGSVMVVIAGAAIVLALLRAYPRQPIGVSAICGGLLCATAVYSARRRRSGHVKESGIRSVILLTLLAIPFVFSLTLILSRLVH